VPEGGIDLMNRGEMGSGHGWTMGWGAAWNNIAKSYVIQMPPGAANWAIGNRGDQQLGRMQTYNPGPELPMLPQGIVESQGTPVSPASLIWPSCAIASARRRSGISGMKGRNSSEAGACLPCTPQVRARVISILHFAGSQV